MNGARARALVIVFACFLSTAGGARAQASAPDPSAVPQPATSVRDPDFGVVARHFGLERDVEMFQWQRDGDAYVRTWSNVPLDSSGFAPGHDNPPLPLRSRQWTTREVRVDGLPLDPAVLETIGAWEPFRPSFSALPGNLAATFQPEGDGLGTAEDPMDPQIGDLRIHWRELRLPALGDRIVAEDGRWRLKSVPAKNASAEDGTDSGSDAAMRDAAPAGKRRTFGYAIAFLLVFFAGFGVARMLRRRSRR